MNKLSQKKKIIDICLQMLDKKYQAAETEMKEAIQAANEVGPPKDRYDPFRSQMARRQNMFLGQCQKITKEKEILKRIDTTLIHDNVTFGAVVISSEHKVFFATSIGKIDIGKETFFVASCDTPLFKAMQNKRTGDSFEINGRKFTILDVY